MNATYTLPIGPDAPQWAQAVHQWALRCAELVGAGLAEDWMLARATDALNAQFTEAHTTPRANSALGAFGGDYASIR